MARDPALRNDRPGTYTFQAILDSSGTVTYQYLTLVGELASATVGIQDATKTVGLQVAYNQAYLHDNMAIRIGAMPQWLSAAPTSGRLWAGESTPINVHIDAANLEGGIYPGQVNILTNDPAHPVLTVDVTLDVTGAPDAVVTPTALDYGDSFLTQPAELILTVRMFAPGRLRIKRLKLRPRGMRFQNRRVMWRSSVTRLFSRTMRLPPVFSMPREYNRQYFPGEKPWRKFFRNILFSLNPGIL